MSSKTIPGWDEMELPWHVYLFDSQDGLILLSIGQMYTQYRQQKSAAPGNTEIYMCMDSLIIQNALMRSGLVLF